jgi:hypothetical protein
LDLDTKAELETKLEKHKKLLAEAEVQYADTRAVRDDRKWWCAADIYGRYSWEAETSTIHTAMSFFREHFNFPRMCFEIPTTILIPTSQELLATTEQMNTDTEVFSNAKKGCEKKADEWTRRAELRKLELDGIAKALEILTSEEAKALFGKAIKGGTTGFIQLSMSAPRNQAYSALKRIASRSGSARLAMLAAKVKTGGHFDKVIKSIDELVAEHKADQAQDLSDRDEW